MDWDQNPGRVYIPVKLACFPHDYHFMDIKLFSLSNNNYIYTNRWFKHFKLKLHSHLSWDQENGLFLWDSLTIIECTRQLTPWNNMSSIRVTEEPYLVQPTLVTADGNGSPMIEKVHARTVSDLWSKSKFPWGSLNFKGDEFQIQIQIDLSTKSWK